MVFGKNCLGQVSLNTLIHFIHNFPEEVFILRIEQLNWDELYEQKKKEDKIQYIEQ